MIAGDTRGREDDHPRDIILRAAVSWEVHLEPLGLDPVISPMSGIDSCCL